MSDHSILTQHNAAVLIDCRSEQEYADGHIAGACSIPADSLFQRMHELPKRHVAIHLCGNPDDLEQATHYLTDRGHTVTDHTVWSAALKQQLAAEGTLETGCESRQLWQPAPLLQRFVNEIVPRYGIVPGMGLDIACGAGRDLTYLATQGWQMTGVDQSADSLERVATLAKYCHVEIDTRQLNLETGTDPLTEFADNSLDLICVARYLHRPLFPVIRRLLKPGGILIYQTFMVGSELTAVGRPRNPNFLLNAGELAAVFSDAERLVDEVEVLDDGRPVAAFIAKMTP